MIGSPYAQSLGQKNSSYPSTMQIGQAQQMPSLQSGIGGVFQQKMGGQPLNVYKDYLNQTYLGREQDALSRQVDEFVDLVDQAERAHFNAEESFGYGNGSIGSGSTMANPPARSTYSMSTTTPTIASTTMADLPGGVAPTEGEIKGHSGVGDVQQMQKFPPLVQRRYG